MDTPPIVSRKIPHHTLRPARKWNYEHSHYVALPSFEPIESHGMPRDRGWHKLSVQDPPRVLHRFPPEFPRMQASLALLVHDDLKRDDWRRRGTGLTVAL